MSKGRLVSIKEERKLSAIVDSIRELIPLKVDEKTQKLLDAAIAHQETELCNVEEWAARLVADVKDAGD